MRSARTGLIVAVGIALAAGTGATAFAIVGGRTVQQAPSWMGSLQMQSGNHECGAVLVSATWAVTAKHCVQEPPSQARFGSLDYTAGGQLVGIARTVQGPAGSDTALVRLSQPVTGAPIPLASSAPTTGTPVTLFGWGQTNPVPGSSPRPPRFLQQLQTQVAPPGTCQQTGAYDLCFTSTVSHTACYGDSGGPAVVAGTLVGVTSRGGSGNPTCGPGGNVYASIPAVASWIRQTVAGAESSLTGGPGPDNPGTAPGTGPGGTSGTGPNNPGTGPNNPGIDPNNPGTGPGTDPGQQVGGPGFPGGYPGSPGGYPGFPGGGPGSPGGYPGSPGGYPGFPGGGPGSPDGGPDQG